MFYIFVFCIVHTNMSKMKWGDNKQCSEIKSPGSEEKKNRSRANTDFYKNKR